MQYYLIQQSEMARNTKHQTHWHIGALAFFFLFCLTVFAFGQDDITYHQAPNAAKNEPKKKENNDYLERISVGGRVGLQVSTYYAFIELSPHAAYHFNDYFCAGIGGSYFFSHDNHYNISSHVFGPNVFAEAHFLNYLGVHLAYQALNYENIISPFERPRIWSNNISIGGGYYQRAGRVAMYFYALYNISDRPPKEDFYGRPLLFKAGFSIFLK
jgi:hypothetical protein